MKWLVVVVLLGPNGTLLRSEPVADEAMCLQRVESIRRQFPKHHSSIHQCVDLLKWHWDFQE